MKKFKTIEEYTQYRYQIQEQQLINQYKPYPHMRPGPEKGSLKKTEIEPDIKLKDFNFASRPVPSIRNFDWTDIKGVAVSSSGTQGVIFIESNEGSIALKGSSDMAIDFFLYKLAKVLNVTVPNLRMVRWYDKEFKIILDNLQRATFSDEVLGRRVPKKYIYILSKKKKNF